MINQLFAIPLKFSNKQSANTIWQHDSEIRSKLLMGTKHDANLYYDVLEVRNKTDFRWPQQTTSVDDYSDLYCMYVNDYPVGSVGATRACNGKIFMEEFCPDVLMDEFRNVIISAYRFRILSDFRRTSSIVPGLTLSLFMFKEGCRQQIEKGAGLDIINIEKSYVPLYLRMGYIPCEETDYIDPVLGTPSCIMYLPVDPTRKSLIQDMIKDHHNIIMADNIKKVLSRKVFAVNY